jgi:hypothetical protein
VRTWFGIQNDSVSLPIGAIAINGRDDNARLAFFSFRSLHKLMDVSGGEYRINSRVASLSLGSSASSNIAAPAKIRLRRIQSRLDEDEQTVCASWDREASLWSSEGCSLVTEESAFSVCECGRLLSSGFALLAGPRMSDVTSITDLSGRAEDNHSCRPGNYLHSNVAINVPFAYFGKSRPDRCFFLFFKRLNITKEIPTTVFGGRSVLYFDI